MWDDKFGLRDLDLFIFRMGYLMYKKVTPTNFGGFCEDDMIITRSLGVGNACLGFGGWVSML
jgi:hypothetical protein